jgi:hypothetical protein
MKSHRDIFTPQYTERSGPGSTLAFSEPYRDFVSTFIAAMKIDTVHDLGCGDMTVSGNIDLHGAHYIGADVIEERIHRNELKHPDRLFVAADLRTQIPCADLVLCKDVIQHWSSDDIMDWLAMMVRAPFRFALITNCNYTSDDWRIPAVNSSIETGSWRPVDLTAKPFSIGDKVFSWGDPNKDVVLLVGTRYSRPPAH